MGNRRGWMLGFMMLAAVAARAQPRPSPEVPDLAGKVHRPLEVGGKGAVLIFVLHDCPISNAYAPEISRIAAMCREKGLSFYLVQVDQDATDDQLRQHAKDYSYDFTVLSDRKRALVKRLGATVAPEAFLLDGTGTTRYRGRIDDRYPALGQKRNQPTKRDLREAIESVLAGKPVAEARTAAVGCSIE